jgi:hypothetical protein
MAIALLIVLYTLCFIVLIDRITKGSQVRLSRKEIAMAYCFKVAMGILYGFVFQKFYGGDDTWKAFNDSLNEYNKLLFQSGQFFKEIIPIDSYHKYPDFESGLRDFLENLEYNSLIKSLGIFNLLTFQNYYADVVFFNLFSFAGCYLLFKLFVETWKEKRLLIYLATFFIPPVTFWLSGIRSDSFVLLSIAIALYYFHSWLSKGRALHLIFFLLGLIGIFIFRMQFLMLVIPFFFSWWLTNRISSRPSVTFLSVLLLSAVIFFASSFFSGPLNLLNPVVQKQREFMSLKGNTEFQLNPLQPTIASFGKTLPQALANTFLRPLPWEARGALQLAAAAEMILFWCIFAVCISRTKQLIAKPLTWFIILFAVSAYLFIGLTVPFPGAIVRYKIVPELLLFLLFSAALPIKLKKIYI